jgi:hypothetical protein
MGGGGNTFFITSRSTSDLLWHHQTSSTMSESSGDKEVEKDEDYLNHEGEGTLSSEGQYWWKEVR